MKGKTLRPLGTLVLATAAALWLAPAAANAAAPKGAYLLIEADSGAVLEAKNATHPWYPASLTKVMTAYLVFQEIAEGRLALDQKVRVSAEAVAQPAIKLGLGLDKMVPVKLLLEAMILRSSNDAAVVLAEAVSGNETVFATAMTRKARRLGMSETIFTNATGLPDTDQVTTARDLAILAQAVIADFPEHFGLFSEHQFTLNRRSRPSINGWLRGYPGAEGFKTGFTCGSGYNLLSAATRDGRRLIAVVLGARSSGARNGRMTKLLNDGFAGAPAGDAEQLEALPGTPGGTPPYVLAAGQCSVAPSRDRLLVTDGRLPGWGLVFGTYITKAKASARIKENQAALEEVLKKGRPAIVTKKQKLKGPQRYSALLVGLKEDDAGQACQHLRTMEIYCVALPPKLLNNPKAYWR